MENHAGLNFRQELTPVIRALLLEEGLQAIADRAAEVLGNPLWIVDMNHVFLTRLSGETKIDILMEENRLGYVTNTVLNYTNSIGLRDKAAASGSSILFRAAEGDYNVLACPVIITNVVVAYVSVIDENRQFRDSDYTDLELIARVISAELQKDAVIKDNKELMNSYMLIDLLKYSHSLDPEDYKQRAELIGLNIRKHIYLLTVELRFTENRKIIMHFLQLQLRQICSNSICCRYDRHIIVLFSTDRPVSRESALHKKLERFLKESNLKAAISSSFGDLRFVPEHYEKTKRALEIGLIRRLDGCLFHYSGLVTDQAVEILHKAMASSDLAGGAVNKIVMYDEKHHASLYNTLKVYLEHSHVVSESAAALNIHTNTMRQRLGRITELTGLDLTNGYISFEMMLAIMLYERETA